MFEAPPPTFFPFLCKVPLLCFLDSPVIFAIARLSQITILRCSQINPFCWSRGISTVDRKVRPCPDSYRMGPGLRPVGVSQSLCGPPHKIGPTWARGWSYGLPDPSCHWGLGDRGAFISWLSWLPCWVEGWDSGQEVLGARHRHQGARLRYRWALTASVGITN